MKALIYLSAFAAIIYAWSDGMSQEAHKSCTRACNGGPQACIEACECAVSQCFLACAKDDHGTACSSCSKKACSAELTRLTNTIK